MKNPTTHRRRTARRQVTMESFLRKVGLSKDDRGDLRGELIVLINSNADLDSEDRDGNRLIHLVVRGSEDRLFKILIDRTGFRGAAAIDLNAVDALGNSAFSDACALGRQDFMSGLLDTGKIDLYLRNREGLSALDRAVIHRQGAVVDRLLYSGFGPGSGVHPDLNSKDGEGRSACYHGVMAGDAAIVDILKRYGGEFAVAQFIDVAGFAEGFLSMVADPKLDEGFLEVLFNAGLTLNIVDSDGKDVADYVLESEIEDKEGRLLDLAELGVDFFNIYLDALTVGDFDKARMVLSLRLFEPGI